MQTAKFTNEEFAQQIENLSEQMTGAPWVLSELCPRLVSSDMDNMSYVSAFDTTPAMANPAGFLHGGVTTIILDNAMGYLCSTHCGLSFTPTVSLNTNYLAPIPCGATVYVKSQITKLGRSLVYLSGSIWLPENAGQLCVTSTAVYAVTDKPLFA